MRQGQQDWFGFEWRTIWSGVVFPFARNQHITPPLGKGGLGGVGIGLCPQATALDLRDPIITQKPKGTVCEPEGTRPMATATPHPPNPPFPRGGVIYSPSFVEGVVRERTTSTDVNINCNLIQR